MENMVHIILPNTVERPLTFYLALEEYLVKSCKEDSFFLWQVPPTVILGRNQDIEVEVNLPYCKEKGIAVFRRKSGGGCVYSDWGNIMLSYITPKTQVDSTFAYFLDILVNALKELGFPAVKSEHNDILIEGKKVSGNAFYKAEKASIVHGTLLYDSNFDVLQKAITPSKEKLNSHGIRSVRQRVENLRNIKVTGLPSLEQLKHYLIEYFCDVERQFSLEELAEVEQIEQEYHTPKFILGQ